MNEKITNKMSLVYYGQKAESQLDRTNFTPGSLDGKPNDMNWPKDFAIPVAGHEGGIDWTFQRTFMLDRKTISDCEVDKYIVLCDGVGEWDEENQRYNIQGNFMTDFLSDCKIRCGSEINKYDNEYKILSNEKNEENQNYVYVDRSIDTSYIYYRIICDSSMNIDKQDQFDKCEFE